MKKLCIISLLCWSVNLGHAQTIITPFAISMSDSNQSVCQTGGEPVILTVTGNQNLTQGFLQPDNLEIIDLYVPNIFSSFSNGVNQSFKLGFKDGSDLSIEQFLIFDRWGNKIYNKNSFDPHTFQEWWDGKFENQELVNGVYTYFIEYLTRGQSKTKKGSITKI